MPKHNRKYPHVQIGQKFERLEVIEEAERDKAGRKYWLCKCECGIVKRFNEYSMQVGAIKSCGCFSRDGARQRHLIHGKTYTTEFNIWSGIKGRIFNPKNPAYRHYGGRGLGMHEEWINSFEKFLNDVGARPNSSYSLDRRSNDEGYYPHNMQWVTVKEQNNNKRNNRLITYDNKRLTLAEWAEITEISYKTLTSRLRRGYSIDELFLPLHYGHRILLTSSIESFDRS